MAESPIWVISSLLDENKRLDIPVDHAHLTDYPKPAGAVFDQYGDQGLLKITIPSQKLSESSHPLSPKWGIPFYL